MVSVLVFVVAALVFTWPLALHPMSRLGAPVGPGDPFLNLWILGWGLQAILSDPMSVLTGRVFNANIFFPAESTLAYSDHLLLQSAVLSPLYALSGDVVLCYNVLLIASLAASGLAMFAFVRSVVGSTPAAYLAGLAWAFWPYRFAHLLHVQLQALYFLPLAFLFLHRVMAGRRRRDAVALGAVAGLQALSSVYYAVIGAVGLAAAAVALAAGVGRRRSSVIARRLLLAAIVGAAIVAPVGVVYWRVGQSEGFGRGLYEASRNAASVSSYAKVPPGNLVFGRTGLLATGGPERELFPGLVVLTLAIAGMVLGWRSDRKPVVLSMAVVAALGVMLSLGPDGVRPVYATFQRFVFGFGAIRAPARFAVLVMFALTTLAAIGWHEVAARRRGPATKVALFALIPVAALEYLNVPMPLVAAPQRASAVGQWLKQEAGPGVVVYLPLGVDIESTPAMVQSLEHRRPLVNGYSGQRPAYYMALADSLSTFPDDEALLALNEIDVRFVVTPAPLAAPAADAPSPLVERARFPDAVVYELQWTPEIEARISAGPVVTPAPPGPLPFAPGETARYVVRWAGAAIDLPAGEIAVTVESPHTFVVRADTAPWVASFFEAHDVFTTRADPQLLPQVHERDQREGTRHATHAYVYSHAERLVRIGRDPSHAVGDDGVSLPLQPWSRDAVSALFYARTLPLQPGERYLIPVNEAGRPLTVELVVAGRESIDVQGRPTTALRVEPRIQQRIERRQPVTATVWLSDDERKVPLAVAVEAGFGRVRAELVSYSR